MHIFRAFFFGCRPFREYARNNIPVLVFLASAGLLLAACDSETAMTRNFSGGGAPAAEVRVAARPPLSLPPQYTMRPDRPGVTRSSPAEPGDLPAFGGGAGRASPGQAALMAAAGPEAAPDIRTRVNEDARLEFPDQGFTDQLMSWQRPPDQPPVIERESSKGLLGRIF